MANEYSDEYMPYGYQRSRSALRRKFGSRAIDGSAPLSPRSARGTMPLTTTTPGVSRDDADRSWRDFFKSPKSIDPGIIQSAPSSVSAFPEMSMDAQDPSKAFQMAGAPPVGGPATMPMRPLTGVTNPGATAGTPSRIQGPNISAGQGMAEGWSKGRLESEAARALGENRAAVSPGGMGTYSYTQAAQASRPMAPFRGGRPQVAVPPTTPTAMQYYQEGIKGAAPFAPGSAVSGTSIASKYGTGSVRTGNDVRAEVDAGVAPFRTTLEPSLNDFSKPDTEMLEFFKRYRRT